MRRILNFLSQGKHLNVNTYTLKQPDGCSCEQVSQSSTGRFFLGLRIFGPVRGLSLPSTAILQGFPSQHLSSSGIYFVHAAQSPRIVARAALQNLHDLKMQAHEPRQASHDDMREWTAASAFCLCLGCWTGSASAGHPHEPPTGNAQNQCPGAQCRLRGCAA